MIRPLACLAPAALFTVALGVPADAGAASLGMSRAGDMKWVCAGVGVEERRALAELRPQANLEILFVTEKRGGYLSDVELTIYAPAQTVSVLRVAAEGPMCLVAVPAGAYRIEARYGGTTRVAKAAVSDTAQRLSRVVLAFPDEAWDGITASEEEKRQARER